MNIVVWGLLVALFSSVFAVAAQTADVLEIPLADETFFAPERPILFDTPASAEDTLLAPAVVVEPSKEQELSKPSRELYYYLISYSDQGEDAAAITEATAEAQQVLQEELDVLYYVPYHKYIAKVSERELLASRDEGYVLEYRLVREDLDRYNLGREKDEPLYYVYAFQQEDVPAVVEALQEQDIIVVDINSYVIVIDLQTVQDKEALLRDLVQIEGVEAIEQRPHYELLNDRTNVVVGTEDIRARFGLYGAGQIIAITDSGLDTGVLSTLHPDIRGRVISLTRNEYDPGNFCNYNGIDDPNGHGTAVTGAAVGNGLQSGSTPSQHNYPLGSYAGAAPESRLVFQASGCGPSGGMSPDFPLNLYNHAYSQGARIHSHSYGSVGTGSYGSKDRDSDQFMNSNKEFIILYGAGNFNGVGTVSNNAKNIITVGGFIVDQPNTQIYARGPTQDGRFKPDILSAAGSTNTGQGPGIKTTYSSVQIPWPTGVCQQLTSNQNYCLASGTSIATPNVAGAAALIREYYITKRNTPNPTAALVKATLLQGGDSLGNGLPSPDYGWGRMNLSNSLIPDMYWDFGFWDERAGLRTNTQRDKYIWVDNGKPLRVTLVWTDKESLCISTSCQSLPKLVNDLDLIVIGPGNQQYNGNDVVPPYNDQWDRRNNVERVEIPNPQPGRYTLRVRGFNVPSVLQDYALVASFDSLLTIPVPAVAICVNSTGHLC